MLVIFQDVFQCKAFYSKHNNGCNILHQIIIKVSQYRRNNKVITFHSYCLTAQCQTTITPDKLICIKR
jgi:hypothetical protein